MIDFFKTKVLYVFAFQVIMFFCPTLELRGSSRLFTIGSANLLNRLHTKTPVSITGRCDVTIANPNIDFFFHHGFNGNLALSGFLNDVLNLKQKKAVERSYILENSFVMLPSKMENNYDCSLTALGHLKGGGYLVALICLQNNLLKKTQFDPLIKMSSLLGDIYPPPHSQRSFSSKEPPSYRHLAAVHSIVITNKKLPSGRKQDDALKSTEVPKLKTTYSFRNSDFPSRPFGDLVFQITHINLSNFDGKNLHSFKNIERWAAVFKDSRFSRPHPDLCKTKVIKNVDQVVGNNKGLEEFVTRLSLE